MVSVMKHQIGFSDPSEKALNPAVLPRLLSDRERSGHSPQDRVQRLQSCASRSSACDNPFSEKVSVVSVPLADIPLTVTSAALRMASTIRSSSAAFLIQRPSPWVYMAKEAPRTSSVDSEPGFSV